VEQFVILKASKAYYSEFEKCSTWNILIFYE